MSTSKLMSLRVFTTNSKASTVFTSKKFNKMSGELLFGLQHFIRGPLCESRKCVFTLDLVSFDVFQTWSSSTGLKTQTSASTNDQRSTDYLSLTGACACARANMQCQSPASGAGQFTMLKYRIDHPHWTEEPGMIQYLLLLGISIILVCSVSLSQRNTFNH